MNLLVTFILLNIANVIIQTIKSLATIKCGKGIAALVNAVAYGLYTVVLVYTVCELPLLTKSLVVALANLVGVYVVKYFEEKTRKDKLWKIEATFKNNNEILSMLNVVDIPHNYIDVGPHIIANFYCATQEESAQVKKFIDAHNGKYFASESKILT